MPPKSASRSTRHSTRPIASVLCCAAPTSRATSRTIEVVLVARKEVGVGRDGGCDLAVVQRFNLLFHEPFDQLGAVDACCGQRDGNLRPIELIQYLLPRVGDRLIA